MFQATERRAAQGQPARYCKQRIAAADERIIGDKEMGADFGDSPIPFIPSCPVVYAEALGQHFEKSTFARWIGRRTVNPRICTHLHIPN
jgi:hypothetical protein